VVDVAALLLEAARDRFLAAVHADRRLQELLRRSHEARDTALRIARAAGFFVGSDDVLNPVWLDGACDLEDREESAVDGIDFDGDGVPDAVRKSGRWVMADDPGDL
jgi:hypothetical protein